MYCALYNELRHQTTVSVQLVANPTMERSGSHAPPPLATAAVVDLKSSGASSLLRKVHFLQQSDMSTKPSLNRGSLKLPVVVIPSELTFIADDPSTHKQTVTIYNFYDFYIKYKVFCTSPSKYQMPDWNGNISPSACKDVTIRMTEITEANVGVTDKFRIAISEFASSVEQRQGEREIRSMLVASKGSLAEVHEAHKNIRQPLWHPSAKQTLTASTSMKPTERLEDRRLDQGQGPSYFVLLVLGVCIAMLLMPNSEAECSSRDDNSWVATYITLTHNQKLIAAYVLGLITMILFRSC
ncbi:motile sperm domain-containing protein 1-like isoform X3 [Varroa jacobsoni]|nr:motile sperm domain-containing protein 1-like isoform X3 [Varroa jacobsoni]